jgi:hypothetical protein
VSGTIVILKPGHTMTAAYRQKLLENNTASFSVAVTDKKVVESFNVLASKHDLDKALFETEEKLKSRLCIIGATSDVDIQPEEQQPFELVVDKDNKPVLSAFISGDFSKYATDTAEFSPEATLVMEWLADKCASLYEESGSNVNKLIQLLDSPAFRKELQEHMEPSGVIVMLSTEGSAIMFARQNTTHSMFDWGEVTNHHGYAEKSAQQIKDEAIVQAALEAKEKAAAEPEKRVLTYKERQALKAQGSAPPPPTATPVPPTEVPVTNVGEYPDKTPGPSVPTVVPGNGGPTPDYNPKTGVIKEGSLFPPAQITGRDLKKWYGRHRVGGSKNIQYESRPGIPASEISRASHFYPMLVTGGVRIKDTEVHNEPSVEVHNKPLPIVPTDQLAKAVAIIKKDAALPLSEEQIKAVVAKHPSWSERHGITFEHMCCLSYETLLAIGTDAGVKDLSILAQELRLFILQNHPEIMKAAFAAQPAVEQKTEDTGPKVLSYRERQALKKAAG